MYKWCGGAHLQSQDRGNWGKHPCEFKANLVYKVASHIAKNNKNKNKHNNTKQAYQACRGASWQCSWSLLQAPALTSLTDERNLMCNHFLPSSAYCQSTYHSYRKETRIQAHSASHLRMKREPLRYSTICGVCSKADTTGHLPVSWDRIKPFAYILCFILYIQTNDKV